jgi:hypothetical protein
VCISPANVVPHSASIDEAVNRVFRIALFSLS